MVSNVEHDKRIDNMTEPAILIERLLSRTYGLQYEDHDKAHSITRDCWVISRKLFGEGNPYLEELNLITFVPRGMIANRENIIMTSAWDAGVRRLKEVLNSMLLEQRTIDSLAHRKNLEAPGKITLQWLFLHVPVEGWMILVGLLSSAFLLGVALGNTTFIRELLSK